MAERSDESARSHTEHVSQVVLIRHIYECNGYLLQRHFSDLSAPWSVLSAFGPSYQLHAVEEGRRGNGTGRTPPRLYQERRRGKLGVMILTNICHDLIF